MMFSLIQLSKLLNCLKVFYIEVNIVENLHINNGSMNLDHRELQLGQEHNHGKGNSLIIQNNIDK